jgi:NAD-dependent SIR2 family protein deacetylase
LVNAICNDSSSDSRYCFILGAGASVESGIPSGQKLAQEWFEELKNLVMEEKEFNKWSKEEDVT